MGTRRAGSTQGMVRRAIRTAAGPIRVAEIRDLLKLPGDRAYKCIQVAVAELVSTGEIERSGYGRYVWKGDRPAATVAPKQNTIWRFAQIRTRKNKPFTAREAHEVTGVGLDLAKRYITFLKQGGYLVVSGQKKGKTSSVPIYLLADLYVNTTAPVMRRDTRAVSAEATMDEIRQMASEFFRVTDTRTETLQKLMATCDRIKAALWDVRVGNARANGLTAKG